jgi:hypothetical protein
LVKDPAGEGMPEDASGDRDKFLRCQGNTLQLVLPRDASTFIQGQECIT